MAKQALNTLKNWFRTGLKPTQSQFWDWMDSFFHKDESIPSGQIEGLQDLLDSKMDKAAVIAPEQVSLYDPAKNYVFDAQVAEYVSFSNPASEDPKFQIESFYRLKASPGQAGRSPETHPEFWVYQGQTLGDITIGDVIGLREDLDRIDQLAYDAETRSTQVSDALSDHQMAEADAHTAASISVDSSTFNKNLAPTDDTVQKIAVKVDQLEAGGGDATSRSYTIDFLATTIVAQDINMFGAAVIDNIIASNVASILLSYSGGLQQVITPGVNAISITAGDILTWEITRTNAGQLAALGIHLSINE